VARSLYFNGHALPVLAHYRALEAYLRITGGDTPSARAEAFAPLHEAYAPLALRVIRGLRGFYIKARRGLRVCPRPRACMCAPQRAQCCCNCL
jgi:hypothetical protein